MNAAIQMKYCMGPTLPFFTKDFLAELGFKPGSDRPKFSSVPVPAEIATKISVPVSVSAIFEISVSAGIPVLK